MIGNLYFIQEGADGSIKIGWTEKELAKRLRALQTGNSRELRLLGAIGDATKATELLWHQRFHPYRVRGEWFWPAPALIRAINAETVEVDLGRKRIPRAWTHGPIKQAEWTRSLRRWMAKEGLDVQAFAQRLGYRATYAKLVCEGSAVLSLPLAKKLEEASGGELRARELLQTAPHTQRIRHFLDHPEAA